MRAAALHIAVLMGAGWVAHVAQRGADQARFAGDRDQTLFLLDGPALKVAAMGYDVAIAGVMWVNAVLRFVDIYEGREPGGTRWLVANLSAVAELDPPWRTVYFYGGGMLRVLGDIEDSDTLYALGMQRLPDDPFFPFSLGMNAYLYRDDTGQAFSYLNQAAGLPGAPRWYRAAAAAFLDHEGERRAALHYLEEQLANETRPEARAPLEEKHRELLHDEYADQLQQAREAWEAQTGRTLTDLGVLGELPPDPYEGRWVLAPDGVIRSSVRDAAVARAARNDERRLVLRPDAL